MSKLSGESVTEQEAKLKSDYTVGELCRTFNIARSTYYYRQNNDQDENTNTEDQLYTSHPAYDKGDNLVWVYSLIL